MKTLAPSLVPKLDAGPDLREALAEAEGEELVELFDAFDIDVSYDKPAGKLGLSASLTDHFLKGAAPNGCCDRRAVAGLTIAAGGI